MPKIANVCTLRTGRITQYVFQGIWRRTHVNVRADKSGTIFVIIFFTMASNVFAPDNTLAYPHVTRKGKTCNTVTDGRNRFSAFVKAKKQIMNPVIVCHVNNRTTATYQKDAIIWLNISLDLIDGIVVGFHFSQEVRGTPVGSVRQPFRNVERIV